MPVNHLPPNSKASFTKGSGVRNFWISWWHPARSTYSIQFTLPDVNSRPSPFLTSVIALTLILLGLFCLSPSILFAQELKIGPTTQNSDIGRAPTVKGLKHAGNAGNVIAVLEVTVTGDVGTANEARTELPEELSVQGSYSNPFRTATSIVYNLPEPAQVYAEVFDILGRVVYTPRCRIWMRDGVTVCHWICPQRVQACTYTVSMRRQRQEYLQGLAA